MKLKMTDDFKKGAKVLIIYTIMDIILVFPIFHLIKGNFDWGDAFINAGIKIVICLVLGVLFYFGMGIPEKKEE